MAADPTPERLIVVADNCANATGEVARQEGAAVFRTKNNRHKKAGALNQILKEILPGLEDEDAVLVMDADSFLDKGRIAQEHETPNRT